jgi:phytoene desaturase
VASVVVIGAGIGGLAVAARLAAQGHVVRVFEASAKPGGKVAGYERAGYVFDTGPSLLTLPAVYRDLFLKTAVRRKNASLEDNVGLVGLDPAFSYRWSDGTSVVLPGSNTNRVSGAFQDALGGNAGAQWQAFSERGKHIWAATRSSFLEKPIDGPVDLLREMRRLNDLRTVAPWKSLRSLGQQYLTDPRLQMVLDRYATYSGSDPRRAPAALAVIPFVEQTFGAWHIEGGVHRLGDAVHQRCLERDVSFDFSSPVIGIVLEKGRAAGVELAGSERFDADVVVSDADASSVYSELLPEQVSRQSLRRLNRATPSFSGFSLLLSLHGRGGVPVHHNVLLPPDYDAEFDSIFGATPQPVADPAIYICSPDDPAMRPDDMHESWFVLVNAPRQDSQGGVDWTADGFAVSYAEQILTRMAERGVNVRDRIVDMVVRTPADIQQETQSPGGAIYGTSSNGARSAFLRPGNRSPVPGLYLVGGSAHPGGGLPLVGMSAAIVAELIGDA